MSVFYIFSVLLICSVYCRVLPKDQSVLPTPVERKWANPHLAPAERARLLLDDMTLLEKVTMLHGSPGPYIGNIPANTRLQIPALNMNDGPQGFRDDTRPGTSTSFPSALTVAAAWNAELAGRWGNAMGEEFFAKGSNIQLGPGMNVARVPLNGRNFEYISGEDPFLGATLVGPVIQGIQQNHVVANAKHWVHNNQETNRGTQDANVDERTRFEIYYPPFEAAVKAGVGSYMCSYNKINGVYSCENPQTLAGDLKTSLGFDGWVMSDWGATHSTSIIQGLDQEMASSTYMGPTLISLVENGTIPESYVDASVNRILGAMFKVGLFDYPSSGVITNNVTTPEHVNLAREISVEATVLLKNQDNILPLGFTGPVSKIALFGSPAIIPTVHGGGSGQVIPAHTSAPFWAIRKRFLGTDIPSGNCSASGYEYGVDYFQNEFEPQVSAASTQDCCGKCSTSGSCLYFSYDTVNKICYLKSANIGRKSSPTINSGRAFPDFPECVGSKCVTFSPSADNGGSDQAKAADVAIVFVETTSGEGSDRTTLSYSNDANNLITSIAAVQPNTIVVGIAPGAVLTPWANQVKGILIPFFPGQEYGNAITSLLFGDSIPSGKLPLTFPNFDNEVNFTTSQYPGDNNGEESYYTEKLEVGYRWYDAHNVSPAFPFGHGLSYSKFDYSEDSYVLYRARSPPSVSLFVNITNSGFYDAKEVVQLYLGFPSSAGEPPQQLKAFSKVFVKAGETVTVPLFLDQRSFSYYDADTHSWVVASGTFNYFIGSSSRDIRVSGQINL